MRERERERVYCYYVPSFLLFFVIFFKFYNSTHMMLSARHLTSYGFVDTKLCGEREREKGFYVLMRKLSLGMIPRCSNCVSIKATLREREKHTGQSVMWSTKKAPRKRQASHKIERCDDPQSNEKTQSCDFFEFFFTNAIE